MAPDQTRFDNKVVLITGAAHRFGAACARLLHAQGMHIVIHYRRSATAAETLRAELENHRPDSVTLVQGDLHDTAQLPALINSAAAARNRLDALINNASSFYPTPVGETTESHWDDLIGTNMKAPFFLSQAAAPFLREQQGCIVNIVDIYANRPLAAHPVYSMAKAGLAMMTRSLAKELGPEVRVNGVAPGAILWPEQGLTEEDKTSILDNTALKRRGNPEDIARTVRFLIGNADYITGQVIAVDGGRSVHG